MTPQSEKYNPFTPERFISETVQLAALGLLSAAEVPEFDPKFIKELKRLDWQPDPVHHHPESQVTISSAFYGRKFGTPQKIYAETVRLLRKIGYQGEIEDKTDSTGFPQLWQMTPGLSVEHYRLIQQVVAKELITQALEHQGIGLSEIDLILVATSIPLEPDFDINWRKAAGIPDTVPLTDPYCMACNSSGRALADVLNGEYDEILAQSERITAGQPANILFFALDDANRESDQGGNPLLPQFFATGAAATLIKYHPADHSSLHMIVHTSKSIEKGTQFLQVRRPYDDWPEEKRRRLKLAQYLKAPSDRGPAYMSNRAGVSFLINGLQVASETLEKYQAEGFEIPEIKRLIVHHPSKAVFDGMSQEFFKLGFTAEQLHWVINEGNVPVATIPIAWGRQLAELEVNDHVMFLSFGAGGEYTCFIAQVGQVAHHEPTPDFSSSTSHTGQ